MEVKTAFVSLWQEEHVMGMIVNAFHKNAWGTSVELHHKQCKLWKVEWCPQ